jgi:branched-chain amino acid transport system permease protein
VSLSLYYFLTITAIYILMSWCLYLPYRVAHLHFLTVANMLISGYLAGFLVLSFHLPFALALLLGFAAGGVVGLLVSLFIGDAPTFTVVIVGFTFIYISRTAVENIKALGGTLGLFGLPLVASTPGLHRLTLLIVAYALVVLVGLLIYRFDRSRLGRAASAAFVDKELAGSLGVDIRRLGRLLQTFSSTVAGGCGVIYAFIYRSLHLDYFTFHLVGIFMTVIFVGGYASMWGTVVAAPLLYGLTLILPPEVASWRIVIYGAILMAVLVLKPEGFLTRRFIVSIEKALSRMRRRNTRTFKEGG